MESKVSAARIKQIKALQQKKFRIASGTFVAEGHKVVREAVEAGMELHAVFGTERPDWLPTSVRFTPASTQELDRMTGLRSAPGLLAVLGMPQTTTPPSETGLILALDGIRDPGNLGTLLRSAEWFGATCVVASPDTVELTNPKVVQAAMGSAFRMPTYRTELEPWLDACNRPVYLADMGGSDALSTPLEVDAVLVIGSESHGIRVQSNHARITIPGSGPTESLNAGVAAGILLARYRQLHPVTNPC